MVINLTNSEIPTGWQSCGLPDFARIVMGQSPSSETYNYEARGIPFFQGKAEFGEVYPRIDKYCSKPNKIANAGATLLSVRAPVGPTNLAKIDCCIGRGLVAIHPLGGIEPKFILYLFRNIEPTISGRGTGSTFNAINKTFIEDIKFALPPLNQQVRIVAKIDELFSELDKGIESLKTARELLKVYRQAVLKHAFKGRLTEQWREANKHKLETPTQLLTRIKKEREKRYQEQLEQWKIAVKTWELEGKRGKKPNKPKFSTTLSDFRQDEFTDLPELPVGYTYTHLSNLGELSRGKSKHRPRKDPALFNGDYPFIQTGEVKASNRIIREYSKTYNDVGLAQSKLWPEGTLCITIAANIAETAFLGFDACFPDSIVGFTANSELVIPEYVELCFKASRASIEAYAPATAQKNINLSTLERLIIPYCSIEEQNIIVNQLEDIFMAIDKTENEIECSLQITELNRQSILKRAFSGQLVKQDPNDEPASILLERIRAEKTGQEKIHGKNSRRKIGEVIV